MSDLVERLRDPSYKNREQIVQSLFELGEEHAIESLFAVLRSHDSDEPMHLFVAMALEKIGPAVVPGFKAIVTDPEAPASARSHAANALWFMKAPLAWETLVYALKDPDVQVRASAAYGLGELKASEALYPLLDAIHDPEPEVRKVVAFALGQIESPAAIASLQAALNDSDYAVRIEAAGALSQIGESAIEPLLSDLKSKDRDRRYTAAVGLWNTKDSRAIHALVEVLDDPDQEIHNAVVEALYRAGDLAWPAVISCLEDKSLSPERRAGAAIVLGKQYDRRVLRPLIQALNDETAMVRKAAAASLYRKRDRLAFEALLRVLLDPDASVRRAAADSLGSLEDKEATPALIAALNDPDSAVRAASVSALKSAGDQRAINALAAALSDPNRHVRFDAAFALRRIGINQHVVPQLIAALRDEYNHVRSMAIQTLEPLADIRTVNPLIQALTDSEREIQTRAANALKRIGTPEAIRAVQLWENSSDHAAEQ